ncbi:malto-oligosyltrehalose synthase [Leptolyngbya sp. FACHB-36]|uniref:malto-oligosyltrehalose synthase n=1 Tax=Leptolyngbya sp. FACHB-36 TaxID=2692808 RepID=UPI0016802BC3|nr:malto-oligosyltrehalose synthase [Leptolyngbya sp. FACHB-36]MBD2020772.1 malto-oligosyltrehalose synthase [Leptolyngbya sp. FACHB-36]
MRIPTATYRIQFHGGFPFAAAQAIVEYLSELGVSDVYASPIFKARSGSSHGYDVVDPTQLNPELGTPEQFDQLIAELQQRDMGWLQDIVPNHMAYDSQNAWLMDVLENGPDSESIDFFDIEWNHAYENFRGKVLTPMLGNFYGDCLENGEIQLSYDEQGLLINYFGLTLPVRIESYAKFIGQNLGQLTRAIGRKHPDFIKLLGILYLIKSVPEETKGKERYDQISFIKSLLWELYTQNDEVKAFFDQNVQFFNGEKGNSESFNPLDSLLSEQFYRLAFWKVAAEEINYRRFFTVNELISVKVEELKVFNKTHSLIQQLVAEGKFTGLRIDHVDGLYDPKQYLERLREKVGDAYITVEKILELEEELPSDWQIQGTSGYEFLNYVNGIFCQSENEQAFHEIYTQFIRNDAEYNRLVVDKKRLIIEKNLAGDVDNLAQKLKRISGQTREGVDFTAHGLARALTEVLALFPVYRTYVTAESITDADRAYIKQVIAQAKSPAPRMLKELDYIQKLLLREDEALLTEEQKADRLHFVAKFQQLTGPLMAKGVEDTLLYSYNRLLSLNEVGGNPSHFGISTEAFHRFNQRKGEYWQHSMNATATHDTKRGEDARSRLNVLSELPQEWEQHLQHWRELNRSHKQNLNGKLVPDVNDEYFLYQTLIGAFPFDNSEFPQFVDRVKEYVIKAVREAKVHTAWLRPDSAYEDGYLAFVDAVLSNQEFLAAFRPFQQRIAAYGVFNSLSQVLLKNAAPGVPDLYQGCELWDLSLVDPDNRRPVDYDKRRQFLKEIQRGGDRSDLLKNPQDGKIKLFLTTRLLHARRHYLELFQQGDYQPLTVTGKFANHVIAFARTHQGQTAIAIAPRFFTRLIQPGELPLGDCWHDTAINAPQSQWKNLITEQTVQSNGQVSLSNALTEFPVALLVRET